ncbi:hypothetical protein GQ457_08G020950 [Hibiscus cannabinus]
MSKSTNLFYPPVLSTAKLPFYPVRPEFTANVPKSRFRQRVCIFLFTSLAQLICFFQAEKTLSARRWHAAFSADGHLEMQNIGNLILLVLLDYFRAGIHPSTKGLVCEFLLGSFDPEMSFDDRNQLREERR